MATNGNEWAWSLFCILHELEIFMLRARLFNSYVYEYISWSYCLSCIHTYYIYIFFAMLCFFSASFRLFSINENFAFYFNIVCMCMHDVYVCMLMLEVFSTHFSTVTHFHDNILHISFNYIFFFSALELRFNMYVCINIIHIESISFSHTLCVCVCVNWIESCRCWFFFFLFIYFFLSTIYSCV